MRVPRRSGLTRPRVVQSFGGPRGWVITSDRSHPPDEVVHECSAVVVSPEPGTVFVAEWTGEVVELHRVLL